jgi:hypothetical protein
MSAKIQRWCVWGGVPMVVLWMIGFWAFAGFLPPPSPLNTPQMLAAMFAEDRTAIRIGLLITAFAATLLAPFFSVITVQMRRIEGPSSPMAYAQLALSALLIIEFIFPLYFLQAAAFRPDRSAETLQTYSDVAWLLFVGVVSTAVLEFILNGVAVLIDQRKEPIFPRWFGYLTLWCAIAFAPGSLCVFFLDGPFAWRGLFCWWIPLGAFGGWFAAATPVLLKVVTRQEQQEAGAPAAASPAGVNGGVDLDARRQVELLTAEVSALRSELVAQRAATAD